MVDVKGRWAFITGASRGIGYAVDKMLSEIDSFGVRIDIVMNNAGLQIAYRNNYFDTPVSDYTESFKINCIAPAMICYHFMPLMIKNGFGRIINTTSGIRLEPQQAGYSASKAALDKITIDLGSTVEGTDVMINLTDPGWCRTDLGGPNAPNAPESAIPGIAVGAFIEQEGRQTEKKRQSSRNDFYDAAFIQRGAGISRGGEDNGGVHKASGRA